MLDAVAKRQVAAAAFAAIVALKLHHVASATLLLPPGSGASPLSPAHLVAWCALDAAYLLVLRFADVPRLRFSTATSAALALALALVNAAIIGALSPSTDVGRPAYQSSGSQYEAGPQRDRLMQQPEFSNSTHILGSHVVNVLPPTLIKMNPNGTTFCVSPTSRQSVDLPVLVKGSPPWTIDYERLDWDGGADAVGNITIDIPGMVPDERRVGTFYLTVDKPGIYRITSIRESGGAEGRVINSHAEVAACPEARWAIADDVLGRTIDRCIDESYEYAVSVRGAPPLRAYYVRDGGQEVPVLTLESPELEEWEDDEEDAPETPALPKELRRLLYEVKEREFVLGAEIKMETAGPHYFKLVAVTDGRNNTITYGTLPRGVSLLGAARQSELPADEFIIDSHEHPAVRFQSCDLLKIRAGAGFEDSSVNLPIVLGGAAPWNIVIERFESEAAAADGGDLLDEIAVDGWDARALAVPVKKPGFYQLRSVSDQFCGGRVELPGACLVQQTFPPTISVVAEPIEQSCVGAIGSLVNVSLTGDPPFWIHYDEIYDNARTRRRLEVNKLRDTLSFKPTLPGKYEYEFKTVGDATYREGVPIDGIVFTQIIHPQSEARFERVNNRILRCVDDSVDLDVHLTGTGPWTLTYEMVFEASKTHFSKSEIVEPHIQISTPPLSRPGTYVVGLINVTDGNGCSWALETPDVSIEVLAQRPSVSFNCAKPFNILEGGSAALPLSFSGRQPFAVKFQRQDQPGHFYEVGKLREGDKVTVSEPGVYEVVEARDSVCTGVTKQPNQCLVNMIAKPRLSISPKQYSRESDGVFIRDGICQGGSDSLEIQFYGKSQFQARYLVERLYDGKTERIGPKDVLAAGKTSIIGLETSKPGVYKYTFSSLADGNYKDFMPLAGQPIVVQQEIMSKPTAKFLQVKETAFQCIGDDTTNDTAIQIALEGQPPFELLLELKHESFPREIIRLANLTDKLHAFRPPALTATGKYALQLMAVRDATGCETSLDRDASGTRAAVQVSDAARIASLNPPAVCVGDALAYTLQGAAPFYVAYEFDGVPMGEVAVYDPLLTLHAAEPGVVAITSVCNHRRCCTHPRNLTTIIHELPTAIVDGGYDLVEDIREGDEALIAVEFKGEPPFSFTYSRRSFPSASSAKGRQPATEEETFTVTNIESPYYSISTTQEGLFQVTAVYDKHCGYPRNHQYSKAMANAVLKRQK